jgi:hypothetical protein
MDAMYLIVVDSAGSLWIIYSGQSPRLDRLIDGLQTGKLGLDRPDFEFQWSRPTRLNVFGLDRPYSEHCSQASGVNIQIPTQPINASFPFNGSDFLVRINTDAGTHADSCVFQYVSFHVSWRLCGRIATSYTAPWSRADQLSLASIVIAGVAMILTVLVAICRT